MRPETSTYNTLTTPVHVSANAIVRAGRWLLPVACVFGFSTVLAFAAGQAFPTDEPIVISAEPQDSSNTSFSRVTSPAYWEDPRQCAQTVDQADIDFYLLAVSADQQQLRANAFA